MVPSSSSVIGSFRTFDATIDSVCVRRVMKRLDVGLFVWMPGGLAIIIPLLISSHSSLCPIEGIAELCALNSISNDFFPFFSIRDAHFQRREIAIDSVQRAAAPRLKCLHLLCVLIYMLCTNNHFR